jgi:hypothetical protein
MATYDAGMLILAALDLKMAMAVSQVINYSAVYRHDSGGSFMLPCEPVIHHLLLLD